MRDHSVKPEQVGSQTAGSRCVGDHGPFLTRANRPETAQELTDWITNHPDRVATKAQASAISFLRNPPLKPPVKIGYRLLFDAALTTIPPDICMQLEVEPGRRAGGIGKNATSALRWALGASPAWQLALVRCDAPIPDGLFRQPNPGPIPGE